MRIPKITWTPDHPGASIDSHTGVDEEGNKYHEAANGKTIRCELADGSGSGLGWTAVAALEDAKKQRPVDLEDLTFEAVTAALDVIDDEFLGMTKRGPGSCGDKLAWALHKTIQGALEEYVKSDEAPAGRRFTGFTGGAR